MNKLLLVIGLVAFSVNVSAEDYDDEFSPESSAYGYDSDYDHYIPEPEVYTERETFKRPKIVNRYNERVVYVNNHIQPQQPVYQKSNFHSNINYETLNRIPSDVVNIGINSIQGSIIRSVMGVFNQ